MLKVTKIQFDCYRIVCVGEWEGWEQFGQSVKQHRCQYCGKAFASQTSLRNHIPVHEGKTTCLHCGKVESTRSNLARHLRMAHALHN